MFKCVFCGESGDAFFDFVPALTRSGLKCFMNSNCNPDDTPMEKSNITVIIENSKQKFEPVLMCEEDIQNLKRARVFILENANKLQYDPIEVHTINSIIEQWEEK